jgi:excisionase family DNA binding protein
MAFLKHHGTMSMQKSSEQPRLYTIQGLAESHGFSRSMIYRNLKEGRLRAIKIGVRVYIKGESVEELIADAVAATFK